LFSKDLNKCFEFWFWFELKKPVRSVKGNGTSVVRFTRSVIEESVVVSIVVVANVVVAVVVGVVIVVVGVIVVVVFVVVVVVSFFVVMLVVCLSKTQKDDFIDHTCL